MYAGQKRAPDLITDGCEPPCGCWELDLGPLEEQSVLLTTEPSLQSQFQCFCFNLECSILECDTDRSCLVQHTIISPRSKNVLF